MLDDLSNESEYEPNQESNNQSNTLDQTLGVELCAGETISSESADVLHRILDNAQPIRKSILRNFGGEPTVFYSSGKPVSTISYHLNFLMDYRALHAKFEKAIKSDNAEVETNKFFAENIEKLESLLKSEKDEDTKNKIEKVINIFKSFQYKSSFAISDEKKAYHTDIKAAVLAISNLSEDEKDFIKSFESDTNPQYITDFNIPNTQFGDSQEYHTFFRVADNEDFLFNPQKQWLDLLKHSCHTFFEALQDESIQKLVERFQTSDKPFYTKISPKVLRGTVIELNKILEQYLKNVEFDSLKLGSLEELSEKITSFEDSALEADTRDYAVSLRQNGYDVLVSIDTPLAFKDDVIANKETLTSMLQPIRKLYQELGGDLDVSIDNYEITIKLSLPQQEYKEKTHQEAAIYACNVGCAPLDTESELDQPQAITFTIPQAQSQPFKFEILKESFASAEQRDEIKVGISLVEKVAKKTDIINVNINPSPVMLRVSDSPIPSEAYAFANRNNIYLEGRKLQSDNPTDIENHNFKLLMPLRYLINGSDDIICRLVSSVGSLDLSLYDVLPQDAARILSEMQNVINLAKNIAKGNVYVNLTKTDLEIKDSNNRTIVKALYLHEMEGFVGRCHSAALTDKVIELIKDIQQSQPKETKKSKKETIKYILSEFQKRNVIVNDEFRDLLSSNFSLRTNNIGYILNHTNRTSPKQFFDNLYKLIDESYLLIDETPDGQIKVSYLDPSRSDIDFLRDCLI